MTRALLVDDSSAVRELLKERLQQRGYEVADASDGVHGAELALADPPDVVITDLWMPGISGVQLCRLLHAEARTAHVPVVLVTGDTDRRAEFWARCAGAAAYVGKGDAEELLLTLERLKKKVATFPPEPPKDLARGTVHERLSRLLDQALFESVVAGEVRALARHDGDAERVFGGLAKLASDIASYRWLALATASPPRLLLHTNGISREASESEARKALSVPPAAPTFALIDDRPLLDPGAGGPLRRTVSHDGVTLGRIALAPGSRGASREDAALVELIGRELRGALRIVTLVEESRRLAMTDPLTGLMNRRAFVETMGRELARLERHATPLSLLLLDIDHFKRINDSVGHEGGDAVLRGLSELLRRMARKSDVLARWGGEEIILGLTQTAEPAARMAAERIRKALASSSFATPAGSFVAATASIGVATAQRGETLEALVARADEAMYAAKSKGRNRIEAAP